MHNYLEIYAPSDILLLISNHFSKLYILKWLILSMRLEEIIAKKNRIVLVETLPFDIIADEKIKNEIEIELSEIFDKPYSIILTNPSTLTNLTELDESLTKSDENIKISENDIVIINSQYIDDFLPNPTNLLKTRKLYYKLKQQAPKAEYLTYFNFLSGNSLKNFLKNNPMRQVLDQIFSQIYKKEDNSEFFDSFIGDREYNLLKKRTLIQMLNYELGIMRHNWGNEKNDAFEIELSQRFMDGNSQTFTEKSFLIISDRPKLQNLKGKFKVIKQNEDYEDLAKIDFSKYAAILVDNGYNFKERINSVNFSKVGNGIKVLKNLLEIGVDIPIIYQTAHKLEDFTEEEVAQVTRFPNVIFMPKNRAFKISNVAKAKKEIAIERIIQQDAILSRYCIKTHKIGDKGYIQNGDDAIVTTDAVEVNKEFSYAQLSYPQRLEVLARFHTRMKDEVNNPEFSHTVAYLRPWEDVREISKDESFEMLYKMILDKYSHLEPTTIIHNDPKWDNWFGGHILGDFGDACPGTEYKDVARALLDKDTNFQLIHDNNFVEQNIKHYIDERQKLDAEFKPVKDFYKNVKELIFIESLRLARFKAQKEDNKNIVNGLLEVAKKYQAVLELEDSYNKIPSIGETEPYTNLEISI